MYKGLEMTSINSYIFDTLPYNEEINIEEIKEIENSLKNYISGHKQEGISYDEAFKFLDWVTFNARSFATRNIPESAVSASLLGACAPTQRINTILLKKMGLDVRPFNMGDCVGDTPMSEEDLRRIENGFSSTNVRHSVAMVRMPIYENGETVMHTYLLDPTFRQFCQKENCDKSIYWNKERNEKGQVAPHPGYFLTEEYLKEKGENKEKIEATDYVARILINRGYMELTEENSKIYGDAFAKAGTRWQFRDVNLNMSGKDYINEFENNRMNLVGNQKDEDRYTKTPSEIINKENILDKIKRFFNKFRKTKQQKCLPESTTNISRISDRSEFVKNLKDPNYIYPGVNKTDQKDTISNKER